MITSLVLLSLCGPAEWISPVLMPRGAKRYHSPRLTQKVYVLDDRNGFHGDVIERVKIEDPKWTHAGGLKDIEGWVSIKYRTIVTEPSYQLERITVKNGLLSLGGLDTIKIENATEAQKAQGTELTQPNLALTREYPNGARFDELLVNDKGHLFEHRTRIKTDRKWKSFVAYSDDRSRPKGYTGLKVSCASCHDEAGGGGYAEGLVPGGDTVLSDPMDWGPVRRSRPTRYIDKVGE